MKKYNRIVNVKLKAQSNSFTVKDRSASRREKMYR